MPKGLGAFLLALAVSATAASAYAQPVPLGTEFVVNSYTTGAQDSPAIASDGSGNVVVVWSNGGEVRGQRYDQAGLPNGTEFAVNASADAYGPAVAMDAAGNFLVTWKRSTPEVVARSYGSDGQPLGTEFRVDSTIFDYEHGYPHGYGPSRLEGNAQVARAPEGKFMVVWSAGYNEYLYHVHERRAVRAQLVTAGGALDGSEFEVGGDMYYYLKNPAIGSSSDGEFVVAWSQVSAYDYPVPENYYYRVRRYDLRAKKSFGGDDIVVEDGLNEPSVAGDGAHRFIVVWNGVFARRFDAQSEPLGPRFDVDSSQLSDGYDPRVAATDSGGFAVVWTAGANDAGDGSGSGVFARTFSSDANPLGTEIAVNAFTTGTQGNAALTFADDDTIVVAWQSEDRDGSGVAVVARRFARAPECGDASADADTTASDALIALGAAVGAQSCAACVCDSDASGAITASDALRILRVAVGGAITLVCPPC